MAAVLDADHIREIRESIYTVGELSGRDGVAVKIVPETPHPDDAAKLYEIVHREAPARTIEIGCATGLSSLTICEAVLRAGHTPDHLAVDPYQHTYWRNSAEALADRAGLGGSFRVDHRESVMVLPELLAHKRVFDAGFIDGCHWFECALFDIWILGRLIRPGGVIVVDDPWMPAVSRAIEYAEGNLGLARDSTHRRNGKPRLVTLRTPDEPHERRWDEFTDFAPAC